MRAREKVIRRALLIALALLLAFVGWRLATLPSAGPDAERDDPVRAASLAADRLPALEVEDAVGDARRAVPAVAAKSPRAIDGWFADRGLVLEARCVDVDGRPLAGVEVSASQAGFESSGESDADGRVRIERNVAWVDLGLSIESFVLGRRRRSVELFDEGEMQVRVVARRAGYAPAEAWPQVILGEVVQAGELVLHRSGTIAGRVVHASGDAVRGARVGASVERLAPESRTGAARRSALGRSETESDASGRFALDDVAAGTVAVGAHDPRGRLGKLPPFEVHAGETTEVEIVIDAAPARPSIRGRVLSSAGTPVARAVVFARSTAQDGGNEQRLMSDEGGAFDFEVAGGADVVVEAWDPRGVHGSARAKNIAPGTSDLVLRLDDARTIALDVVRADGTEPDRFFASVLVPRDDGAAARSALALAGFDQPVGTQFASLDVERDRPGPHRIAIPRAPFVVHVSGAGLRARELGPFDPDRVPDVLRVELTPLPTLTGRVLRDGAPVAGARVQACVPLPGGGTWLPDGLPSRFRSSLAFARTDRAGRFTLTADLPRGTRLRADARGSAPAETEPLAIDDASAPAEVEIVLTRGGDLEGHVVVDAGRDPAGIVVGITRGDGFARTQRTDRTGRFRFEYLTPGAWFVCKRENEIQPRSSSFSSQTFGPEHAWPTNTRVVEGRTTFFELDLREPPRFVVAGRALADARPLAGWRVALLAAEFSPRTLERERTETTLDDEGHFELDVREPGQFQLTLRQDVPHTSARTIEAALRVDGPETSWSCEFTTGTLTGTAPRDGRRLHHLARTAAGALVSTPIALDAEGRFRLEGVAAGPGAIVVEPARPIEVERALWPVVREVVVPAGGVAQVQIP